MDMAGRFAGSTATLRHDILTATIRSICSSDHSCQAPTHINVGRTPRSVQLLRGIEARFPAETRVLFHLQPAGVRQPQIQLIHGTLSGVKAAGSVKLTTQLHMLQSLHMRTLLPPIFHTPSWCEP
jgi:hypothetical protein